MRKRVKIILFSSIFFLILLVVIVNQSGIFEDDMYIVSKNNTYEKSSNKPKDIVKTSQDKSKEKLKHNQNIQDKKITVYISGAVNKPGIVTIESNKRLYDAIELLGGTNSEADLNGVNLALKLQDEQHYIIPKIGDAVSVKSSEDSSETNIKNDFANTSQYENNKNKDGKSKVNINTAELEELDSLPGIGDVTANKILQHREENGKFTSIEDIKNVNGIGDKKYEDLKELICTD